MNGEQKSIRELIAIPVMCQGVHLAKHVKTSDVGYAKGSIDGQRMCVQRSKQIIRNHTWNLFAGSALHWPSINVRLVHRQTIHATHQIEE